MKKKTNFFFQKALLALLFCFLFCSGSIQAQDGYKNYVGFWIGGGYSSINHSIPSTSVPGGAGGLLGAIYQGGIGKFMFNTGAEFSFINSTTKLNDFSMEADFLYIDPVLNINHPITYNYSFNSYKDVQNAGYINIPLLLGYRFTDRYYGMIGVKYGINIFGNYSSKGQFSTIGADPEFIEDMTNMPNHWITDGVKQTGKGSLSFASNLIASVELGVYLDEWVYAADNARAARSNGANSTPTRRPSYRVALFADYGLSDIQANKTVNTLLQYPPTGPQNPLDISNSALFTSTNADAKKLNTLMIGIKGTMLFELSAPKAPKKQPKKVVKKTRPKFNAQVIDIETNEPLTAQIILKRSSTNVQVMKSSTNKKTGVVSRILTPNTYLVEITRPNYITYTDTITTTESLDTMVFRLTPKPILKIKVVDAETNAILTADVVVTGQGEKTTEFKGTTDAVTGEISKIVDNRAYSISVSCTGYMPRTETISSVTKSTITIALNPIKKNAVIVLKNLFFDFDKSTIQPASEPTLVELYELLRKNPNMQIRITGHTDNKGTDTYNERLSRNRAKSVLDEMVKRGIDASRMSFEGKGSKEPIATNDTDEGRAENRRVEITILKE